MGLYIKIRFALSGVLLGFIWYLFICLVQSLMAAQVYNFHSCLAFIESYFEMCNSRKYPYYQPLPTEGGGVGYQKPNNLEKV